MIAFHNFEGIEKIKDIEVKHKAWLKDYEGEGLIYSIAYNGKHKVKWRKEKLKYKTFSKNINCIGRLPNRTIIEFDGNNAKKYLEEVYLKLKEKKWGFIRSTHNGKSDYLWIEFNREITDKEIQNFLKWICPEGAEIDLNFASSKRVFPILYATHWKHSISREMPIEYFKGEQIDYNSLNLKENKEITSFIKKSDYIYHTFKKATTLFTKKGQAKEFNKIQPLFYDKSGLWWLWDTNMKYWSIVDEIDILNMISDTTGEDTINSKNRNEILNSLKQEGRKNIPKKIKPSWIQFKNIIVDYKTGEKFEASPEYFVTNPIPWELHEENIEETPKMDEIFKEWVGEEHIKTLYQILAYCLLPSYPIHRLFCLIGDGMNGKSCFLRLLSKFIGPENITATELDVLLTSRFEITRLHKKLVCVMGETNFSELSKTSLIKKLTGQDIIGFEYKNKNPFEDNNYAKILIATNNLPITTDKTVGFYRRWCIIDFPNSFSEEEEILDRIPNKEYSSLALKSLITLKDLLNTRRFHKEGSVKERTKKYEEKSDFLQKFLDEFIIENLSEHITKADFYKKFTDWCIENRHRKMAENTLGKKMKEYGIEAGRKYVNWLFDGKGGELKIWLGIKWKN